jgi:hypothetical protein
MSNLLKNDKVTRDAEGEPKDCVLAIQVWLGVEGPHVGVTKWLMQGLEAKDDQAIFLREAIEEAVKRTFDQIFGVQ